MVNKILRLPAVKSLTGLSRSTIYIRVANDSFPKQIDLGSRAVGWVESEILEWIDKRIQDRDNELIAIKKSASSTACKQV